MTRFFDASSIVRCYTQQGDSSRARELLGHAGGAISRLSEVEVPSAFARLQRESAMSEDERDAATAAFLNDLDAWVIVDLTPQVTAAARNLLVRYPLRAGDAIQLASALVLVSRLSVPLEGFVASDRRLIQAARGERLVVIEG